MAKFVVHTIESSSKEYVVEADNEDDAKSLIDNQMDMDDPCCPAAKIDAVYDRKISADPKGSEYEDV